MKFLGVDHIDIVVSDLQKSIEFYRKFGMHPEGTVDDGETVFMWNGDNDRPVRIELHQAKPGDKTGIDHLSFAVGMRLHFLIFASLQNVPFVSLPYASKVAGFLEDMQIEMPPIHQVNAGRLIAHVDYAWDHRRQLQSRIRRALPALQERARQTNEIAVRLLTETAQARGVA